jgi:hypothetical protein
LPILPLLFAPQDFFFPFILTHGVCLVKRKTARFLGAKKLLYCILSRERAYAKKNDDFYDGFLKKPLQTPKKMI